MSETKNRTRAGWRLPARGLVIESLVIQSLIRHSSFVLRHCNVTPQWSSQRSRAPGLARAPSLLCGTARGLGGPAPRLGGPANGPGKTAGLRGGTTACQGETAACQGGTAACQGGTAACQGGTAACQGGTAACQGKTAVCHGKTPLFPVARHARRSVMVSCNILQIHQLTMEPTESTEASRGEGEIPDNKGGNQSENPPRGGPLTTRALPDAEVGNRGKRGTRHEERGRMGGGGLPSTAEFVEVGGMLLRRIFHLVITRARLRKLYA